MDTAFIRYERAYYQDRRKCLDSFRDRMSRFVEKTNLISLLLTLPDPPGDLRQGLRMLEQIKGELAQIGRKDKKAAQAITRTLAAHLAIPSRSLSPRTATTGRR